VRPPASCRTGLATTATVGLVGADDVRVLKNRAVKSTSRIETSAAFSAGLVNAAPPLIYNHAALRAGTSRAVTMADHGRR